MSLLKGCSIRKVLFFLVAVSLLRGLAYLFITPPWQAPDETTNFQFMELLTQRPLSEIRKVDLMTLNDPPYLELEGKILQSMKKHRAWEYVGMPVPDPFPLYFYQAPFFSGSGAKIFRPPLYYLIGASILELINPKGLEARLYVARLYSLILSLGAIVLSCLIGYRVFKDEVYALVTGVFVSFLPQFMVIGTSVNSDNLVNLLGAVFLLYAVFVLDNRKTGWYLALVPFLLFALFLSGKTGLIFLPIGFLLFAFQLLQMKSKDSLYVIAISILGLLLVAVFLADLFPGTILERLFISERELAPNEQIYAHDLGFLHFFMVIIFKSFWFVGGWMAIYWNRWVYAGLAGLTILSIWGLFLIFVERLAKRGENFSPSNSVLLAMAISAFMAFLACQFYYGWVKQILAQGRYLFIVLSAIGILFMMGLKKICPRPILPHFPYLFVILMVCLDLYTLLVQLLPYYYFR